MSRPTYIRPNKKVTESKSSKGYFKFTHHASSSREALPTVNVDLPDKEINPRDSEGVQIINSASPWWRTERSLTSKRVRILLSDSESGAKLSRAIRAARTGSKSPFVVGKGMKKRIKAAK